MDEAKEEPSTFNLYCQQFENTGLSCSITSICEIIAVVFIINSFYIFYQLYRFDKTIMTKTKQIVLFFLLTLIFFITSELTSSKLVASLEIFFQKISMQLCYGLFLGGLTKFLKDINHTQRDNWLHGTNSMIVCIIACGAVTVSCIIADFFFNTFVIDYCQNRFILLFSIFYNIFYIAFCLMGIVFCDNTLDQLTKIQTDSHIEFDFSIVYGIETNFLLDQLFYLKAVLVVNTQNALSRFIQGILKFMVNSYETNMYEESTVCHQFVGLADGDRLRFYNKSVQIFELIELIFYFFENLFELFQPIGLILLIFYETCKSQTHENKHWLYSEMLSDSEEGFQTKNLRFGEEVSQHLKEK